MPVYAKSRCCKGAFRKRNMPKRETVLVTGGAGYVGSHVIVELLNSEYEVVALDNLTNYYAATELEKPESLKRAEKITGKTVIFYNVDILNEKGLHKIFQVHKIDCVIHCAALKAVGESVRIPLQYYRINIAGSSVLLEVMQDHNVKKLVFSSSATVYGIPQFLPITEEHPTGQKCTNPYGKSKYIVEEMLKDICASDSQWRIIILRYFNPVGAHKSGLIGENPTGTPSNLMPYVAQVATGLRDKVQVFGSNYDTPDGTGVRDYIHITDLANGHVKAVQKLSGAFQGWDVYNLGAGRGYSVLEVIDAFSEVAGRKISYDICARKEGDVAASYADATRAERELNWSVNSDIKDMCRDAWKWQLANPHGFKK